MEEQAMEKQVTQSSNQKLLVILCAIMFVILTHIGFYMLLKSDWRYTLNYRLNDIFIFILGGQNGMNRTIYTTIDTLSTVIIYSTMVFVAMISPLRIFIYKAKRLMKINERRLFIAISTVVLFFLFTLRVMEADRIIPSLYSADFYMNFFENLWLIMMNLQDLPIGFIIMFPLGVILITFICLVIQENIIYKKYKKS